MNEQIVGQEKEKDRPTLDLMFVHHQACHLVQQVGWDLVISGSWIMNMDNEPILQEPEDKIVVKKASFS